MSAGDWLAIIAAVCSGIATILTAYAALVKSRHEATSEAEAECEQRLKTARQEAEQAADELHALRMAKAAGE